MPTLIISRQTYDAMIDFSLGLMNESGVSVLADGRISFEIDDEAYARLMKFGDDPEAALRRALGLAGSSKTKPN